MSDYSYEDALADIDGLWGTVSDYHSLKVREQRIVAYITRLKAERDYAVSIIETWAPYVGTHHEDVTLEVISRAIDIEQNGWFYKPWLIP